MVDLSKYTVTIGCDDDDNFVALCEQLPRLRIVEDTYKAAYDAIIEAIGNQT